MQFPSPSKILAARVLGDQRSYVLTFSAAEAPLEVFLAASWPDGVHGYMAPSIRSQVSGERSELPWSEAERLGVELLPLTNAADIAGGGPSVARECVLAILHGKRVGSV